VGRSFLKVFPQPTRPIVCDDVNGYGKLKELADALAG